VLSKNKTGVGGVDQDQDQDQCQRDKRPVAEQGQGQENQNSESNKDQGNGGKDIHENKASGGNDGLKYVQPSITPVVLCRSISTRHCSLLTDAKEIGSQ
jgi:hypothetical protein